MVRILCVLAGVAVAVSIARANDGPTSSEPPLIGALRAELPPGWTCIVVKEQGKRGHPHGLAEPLFRADFTNPRQVLSMPSRKNTKVHPRVPLYFYPIRSKKAVMKTVAAERFYSWDIPIYFGETADYLVITSPAYVNNGFHAKEARRAVRPMWTILRKHIKNKEGTNVDELARPGE